MYDIQKIHDIDKLFMVDGAEFTESGMPILERAMIVPDDVVAFNDRNQIKQTKKYAVHFYSDDYRWIRVWNNPTKYMEPLKTFQAVISPDFSMYTDMSVVVQKYNCYRNRAMAHYFSKLGMKVIPSVSWADESSYEWCFDGLPEHSILSVSTNGCHNSKAKPLYIEGMKEMFRRLNPVGILVVGKPIKLPEEIERICIYYKAHGQLIEEYRNG